VLARLLEQFRLVAGSGSRLAISLSIFAVAPDLRARAMFHAAVAALGEPVRSTLDLAEAQEVLERSGWQLATANEPDQEARARRERCRSIGLLLAELAR